MESCPPFSCSNWCILGGELTAPRLRTGNKWPKWLKKWNILDDGANVTLKVIVQRTQGDQATLYEGEVVDGGTHWTGFSLEGLPDVQPEKARMPTPRHGIDDVRVSVELKRNGGATFEFYMYDEEDIYSGLVRVTQAELTEYFHSRLPWKRLHRPRTSATSH